jgi:DNA-binding helix-hairpin-helix protein with protein kinase domain
MAFKSPQTEKFILAKSACLCTVAVRGFRRRVQRKAGRVESSHRGVSKASRTTGAEGSRARTRVVETQLRHYLEQFDIASADIPHIKEGRKAMLSAYGIDDAADVVRSTLETVPGFGHFWIIQLITWRQSLEATFEFNPGRSIARADIQRVDHEIAKRRVEIEALLSKGPSELNNLRRRIIAARGRLQDQLQKALMDVAQAQADERAAT